MMKVSAYLRARAECIFNGKWPTLAPRPLARDWYPFVEPTVPDHNERVEDTPEQHVLRLCLAAAIAESEGQ